MHKICRWNIRFLFFMLTIFTGFRCFCFNLFPVLMSLCWFGIGCCFSVSSYNSKCIIFVPIWLIITVYGFEITRAPKNQQCRFLANELKSPFKTLLKTCFYLHFNLNLILCALKFSVGLFFILHICCECVSEYLHLSFDVDINNGECVSSCWFVILVIDSYVCSWIYCNFFSRYFDMQNLVWKQHLDEIKSTWNARTKVENQLKWCQRKNTKINTNLKYKLI